MMPGVGEPSSSSLAAPLRPAVSTSECADADRRWSAVGSSSSAAGLGGPGGRCRSSGHRPRGDRRRLGRCRLVEQCPGSARASTADSLRRSDLDESARCAPHSGLAESPRIGPPRCRSTNSSARSAGPLRGADRRRARPSPPCPECGAEKPRRLISSSGCRRRAASRAAPTVRSDESRRGEREAGHQERLARDRAKRAKGEQP